MTRARRDPWSAVALSLVVPGLGHIYAGQPRHAARSFLLALATGVGVLALLLWYPLGSFSVPVALLTTLFVYLGVAADAARTAKRAPQPYALKRYNRWYVYAGVCLAVVVGGQLQASATRIHLVRAYRIPSGAMTPTLLVGDWLFVSPRSLTPQELRHGLLAVYEMPLEPDLLVIKRIVGLPGDTLSMVDGLLYLDGRLVDEPYVREAAPTADRTDPAMRQWQLAHFVGEDPESYQPSMNNWGPLFVPRDSLFFLGDSRTQSFDTRYHGLVAFAWLRGQPMHIYFSYDPQGGGPLPFFTAIRWDRLGRSFP